MTEFSGKDVEALFRQGPATHFENTILRGAFMRCVGDEKFAHRAVAYRTSTLSTIGGEKELLFESEIDEVSGQRGYGIKILETQRTKIGQLDLEVRAYLFNQLRQKILAESGGDDPDEVLAEDVTWRRLTDPNNLDTATYAVESGWGFRIMNGEASKYFIARSMFNDELLYDENEMSTDEYYAQESFDDTLGMIEDDMATLEEDDYRAMIAVLDELGLVTRKSRNRYERP
jgi:hypothetical protein